MPKNKPAAYSPRHFPRTEQMTYRSSPGTRRIVTPEAAASHLPDRVPFHLNSNPFLSSRNPNQVAHHSAPDDAWVSFHGNIYDITRLISENEGPLVGPLLKNAGADISHWFNLTESADESENSNGEKKKVVVVELKTHVDAVTNLRRPYVPHGRFVHVPPNDCSVEWDSAPAALPWWQDRTQIVGRVSRDLRKIRIKNVLTRQEHLMEVPGEETLQEIQQRYAEFNWHAQSYAWRVLKRADGPHSELKFTDVELEKTLEENGLVDDTQTFEELSIPNDAAIPVIHLYFKDDLTVA